MADKSFSPPDAVRKNAARALKLRKEHNRGMTMVGVARARDLSNGKGISADTIRRMHSYFARHEVDKKGKDWANQSNPSAGYIAWLGWGGDAGRSWVNGIIRQLDAAKTKESVEEMSSSSTRAAVIRGTFLRPGLSKNNRLYTKENIGRAVARMQDKLTSGSGLPLTMATSHRAAYDDDATSTVGRITHVSLMPDGSATFEADIANTTAGRDVANLAVGKFIKGISIRGEWMGQMKQVEHEGVEATTSDDLEVFGIDFTHRPGVEGAEVELARLMESASAPNMIFESVDEVEVVESEPLATILLHDKSHDDWHRANGDEPCKDEADCRAKAYKYKQREIDAKNTKPSVKADKVLSVESEAFLSAMDAFMDTLEAADKTPYGDVTYADPGYQADKKKRYPIDTEKHVRAAWSYINQGDNASQYTAAQVRRIKSRIKSAASKFGIQIKEEHEMLAKEIQDVLEAYASTTIDNGAATISISGQTDDAGKLAAVANRLATAAVVALNAVDPDADGDIYLTMGDDEHPDSSGSDYHPQIPGVPDDIDDVPYGDQPETDDNNMETECHECGGMLPESAAFCPGCGAMTQPYSSAPECCSECGTQTPESAMYCPTCGHPVPQAESDDSALDTKEAHVADDQTTVEASAEASEEQIVVAPARTLTDADIQALAAVFAAALKPAESAPEAEETPEVAPEEAPEASTEETPEAPEAEEAHENTQENIVSENTFTAEQVAAMVAEAASKAAAEAVEAARNAAVESYRSGEGFRKGFTSSNTGINADDLSESEELDPRSLAEMNSSEFRKIQAAVWGETPFFKSKFAQAERGF